MTLVTIIVVCLKIIATWKATLPLLQLTSYRGAQVRVREHLRLRVGGCLEVLAWLADLLRRVWRCLHLVVVLVVATGRSVWAVGARGNRDRRHVLTQVQVWGGWRFIALLLHPVAARALLDMRILLVLLLFRIWVVVHGCWVVDELAEGLLAELGGQILLVAVKQVAYTVALLE